MDREKRELPMHWMFRGLVLITTVVLTTGNRLSAEDTPAAKFVYKKTKEGDLGLSVHYPPGWKKSDRRPGIIFFFGGAWTTGKMSQFDFQADYFAGRGLVAVRADYRVKSRHGVTPDRCVEDAKSAIRWLRQNAGTLGIDPERIIGAGGSAGGHIVACAGCCPGLDAAGEDLNVSSRPNVLVLFNPVLSFQNEKLVKAIRNDAELARKMSPVMHVAKDTPPTLLLFGSKDRLLQQGTDFVAAAGKAGSKAELFTAPDVDHGFFNRSPWKEKTLLRADEFLQALSYLKGKATIKIPAGCSAE